MTEVTPGTFTMCRLHHHLQGSGPNSGSSRVCGAVGGICHVAADAASGLAPIQICSAMESFDSGSGNVLHAASHGCGEHAICITIRSFALPTTASQKKLLFKLLYCSKILPITQIWFNFKTTLCYMPPKSSLDAVLPI